MPRRGRGVALSPASQLVHLRAMTDLQLVELRSRAVSLLLHLAKPADSTLVEQVAKAKQLLDGVLKEQQLRRVIAALPDPSLAMELHRRTDAELLDEARRWSTRPAVIGFLKLEWAHRHAGADLLSVLKRGGRT